MACLQFKCELQRTEESDKDVNLNPVPLLGGVERDRVSVEISPQELVVEGGGLLVHGLLD